MADPTPTPRLDLPPDPELGRYQPLSWLAVASLTTGVVFVLLLVVLGYFAVKAGKPLRDGVVFVLPALGVGLAFAARRSIRNSEGTRAGEGYAAAGWWVSVVAGLIFLAYWFAVDWAVRSEAEKQMARWAEEYLKGDPNDPNDPALRNAFIKTIPVANQDSPQVRDPKIFQAAFGPQFATFRQTNLLLLARRNRDSVTVIPQGLRRWELADAATVCEVAGTLRCAEGDFQLLVRMQSVLADGTRKWQVLGNDGYLPEDNNHRLVGERTRYGWLIHRLDGEARHQSGEFTYTLMNQQIRQPMLSATVQLFLPMAAGQSLALDAFTDHKIPAELPEKVLLSSLGRVQVAGGAGLFWGGRVMPADDFFAREDGAPLSPEDRKVLASCWDSPVYDRIVRSGQRNPLNPLHNTHIEVTDTAVTVRVPVEMRPSEGEFKLNPQMFSTGKLVLVCDDPAVMSELKQAKAGDQGVSLTPPPDLTDRRFRFKVVRLESNLPKLTPPTAQTPPQ